MAATSSLLSRFSAPLLLILVIGCAAQPDRSPDGDLRQVLDRYDQVVETAADAATAERALAEEVFYLSYRGTGSGDGRLPVAYLAAMEGLTQRLRERNPRSPWLAQAWYHVGEGRRLRGDLDGALAAFENSLANPCSGAAGVYTQLSLERIEAISYALENPTAELPPGRTGCPPAPLKLEFPQ